MTAPATPSLRYDWTVVVVFFTLALTTGAVMVAVVTAFSVATQWFILTIIVGTFELQFLYQHLDMNHPEGGKAGSDDSIGLANAVTLTRGSAFAAVAGFAAVEPTPALAWVPALLYGLGCLLDWVDGYVARTLERTTVLGAKLDMAFDTLGVLVASVVAVRWGRLPVWYLSLSAARYLFKAGRGLRRWRGKPIAELPPSAVRRSLAGLQMAFITVALAPVFHPETIEMVAVVVLSPSLIVFVRDYLVMAGHLDRQKDHY